MKFSNPIRVYIETKWFQKFWEVNHEYARHLALKNEQDRQLAQKNVRPLKGRNTWDLVRELIIGR